MSLENLIINLIIATPIYFLSKFFLKKANLGNDKNRKYIAVLSTVIISPIINFLLVLSFIFYMTYYPTEPFDQQKWETNIEKRYTMSEDVIKSKMLIGKTKEEVVKLLGKECTNCDDEGEHISYHLGLVPGIANIDPDILEIYFENGKVVKVSQRRT
ncbi:MAG: hypothetical protein FWC50_00215 [Planctomycetaceae bacterium]|nr:hypothetical protein [Planctomycetaceae bacterium]